jgi:hypothetical protein
MGNGNSEVSGKKMGLSSGVESYRRNSFLVVDVFHEVPGQRGAGAADYGEPFISTGALASLLHTSAGRRRAESKGFQYIPSL